MMKEISQNKSKSYKNIAKHCFIAYVILASLSTLMMGLAAGLIVGLAGPVIYFIVEFTDLFVGENKGLQKVMWNESTLELLFSEKTVCIRREDIRQVKQHSNMSKSGISHLDIFTFYGKTGKTVVDLRTFSSSDIAEFAEFFNDENRRIVEKEKQRLAAYLLKDKIVSDCQYKWGQQEQYSLTFDTKRNKIIFKYRLMVAKVELNKIGKAVLADADTQSTLVNVHARYWIFIMKEQDGQKIKYEFLSDEIISESEQKEEIYEAIIAICRMNNVPIELKFKATRYHIF